MHSTRSAPPSENPRFSLFLRPFSVTRKLSVPNPNHKFNFLWPDAVGELSVVDLETLLSDAFTLDAPLIGLGKPGEATGAGRIETSEEVWQREIKKLAFAAESILVIPSISEGTRWEIEFLKESHLLSKCIFVMPPQRIDITKSSESAIGKLPIWVPSYNEKGMLYTVDSKGGVSATAGLDIRSTRGLVSRLKELSREPVRDALTFKISDQPVVRFFGAIGLQVIVVPLLAILLMIIIVAFMELTH